VSVQELEPCPRPPYTEELMGRICRNPERYPDRSARWRHIGEGADCVFEVTTLLRALLASPLVQLQVIATAVAPHIHGLTNSLQKL
jgi:hypothetical protein